MDEAATPGPSRTKKEHPVGISSDDEDTSKEKAEATKEPSADEKGKAVAVASSVESDKPCEEKEEVTAGGSLRRLKTYMRRRDSGGQEGDIPSADRGEASDMLQTYKRRTTDYQLLQVANNYCKAAYKEVMRMARDAGTWVRSEPGVGSVDDILSEFRTPPQPGKKLEFSVATAVIPNMHASRMANMMLNVRNDWSHSFFAIGTYGEEHKPRRILQRLTNTDTAIRGVIQVSAEVQLPTTLVPTRYFEFLRYGKEIMPGVYIIVDISSHYFGEPPVKANCRRRPSGVIIREHGSLDCEIVWVENVEVDEPTENMYSSITKSNFALSANHWINALLWKLRRDRSYFTKVKVDLDERAGTYLLALTQAMRHFYIECVTEHPNEDLLSVATTVEDPIRILHNKTLENFFCYVGVNSFRVQAKPLSVFQFLMKKDLQLEFRSNSDSESDEGPQEEPEVLFKFITDDNSNIISLHRKKMEEGTRYCLLEASRDEYCSFILSKIMGEEDLNVHMVAGVPSSYEQSEDRAFDLVTSGFAIMPDGPGGLHCNGSLVTFLMQLHYDPELGPVTIDSVREDFVEDLNDIIQQLNEEVVGKNE